MVVSKRELANISFSLNLSLLSNPPTYNNMNMNMEINTPRVWSNISSTKSFRELLVNSSALFIPYIERMLALNNSFFWTEQVEHTKSQEFFLSYTSLKTENTGRANKTTVIANTPESQGECINSIDMSIC